MKRRSNATVTILCLVFLLCYAPAIAANEAGTMTLPNVFGPGWTVDSLANLEIGRFPNRSVDYRFRSNHTGNVVAVELYFIYRSFCWDCYANGNGGNVRIEFKTDDGTTAHLPSNTVMGMVTIPNPMAQSIRRIQFPGGVTLTQGDLYHVVFSNTSSDPVDNYISIDDLYTSVSNAAPQPAASAEDLAVLYTQQSVPWTVSSHHLPIFSLYFSDGFRQGQIYMDVAATPGVLLSGVNEIEELFTVQDAAHAASSLYIRAAPLTPNAVLRARLISESTILADVSVTVTSPVNVANWIKFEFKGELTLTQGQRYSILLGAEPGSRFRIVPMQNGSSYGLLTTSSFSPSACVIQIGTALEPCIATSTSDIPFYLRLAY